MYGIISYVYSNKCMTWPQNRWFMAFLFLFWGGEGGGGGGVVQVQVQVYFQAQQATVNLSHFGSSMVNLTV